MIAVIDNYDSFTYNLVQFLGDLILHEGATGATVDKEIRVWRNDEIDVEDLIEADPTHVIISPGPGTPEKDSGVSNDVIRTMGPHTPILGVCLGQQCIGHVYGGEVVRAPRLMHGKVSPVHHKGSRRLQECAHAVHGDPIPQFDRGRTAAAGTHRDRFHGRRRADGPATYGAPSSRCAVPPGKHSDGARQENTRQLPAHGACLCVAGVRRREAGPSWSPRRARSHVSDVAVSAISRRTQVCNSTTSRPLSTFYWTAATSPLSRPTPP